MFKLLNPLLFCLLALGSAQSPLPFAARPGILGRPDLLPRPLPLPPTLAANARGVYQTPYVPIVDYSNEINVDGSYRYSFVTADGKQAEESGYLKNVSVNQDGDPVGVQVVQGSYSYTAPDGTPVQVTYIADENGFQPTSVRVPSDGRLPPASVAAAAAAGVLPRGSPYNSQYRQAYRNPYAVNPLLGRFSNPYVDPYAKPVAPVNVQ